MSRNFLITELSNYKTTKGNSKNKTARLKIATQSGLFSARIVNSNTIINSISSKGFSNSIINSNITSSRITFWNDRVLKRFTETESKTIKKKLGEYDRYMRNKYFIYMI